MVTGAMNSINERSIWAIYRIIPIAVSIARSNHGSLIISYVKDSMVTGAEENQPAKYLSEVHLLLSEGRHWC